jgi:hypothetical protein
MQFTMHFSRKIQPEMVEWMKGRLSYHFKASEGQLIFVSGQETCSSDT